jgi:hypothetical protein
MEARIPAWILPGHTLHDQAVQDGIALAQGRAVPCPALLADIEERVVCLHGIVHLRAFGKCGATCSYRAAS